MKKIWRVTVNSWGWSHAKTYYFESKREAIEFSDRYPTHDDVQYAGRFTDRNADILTGKYEPR